MKVLHLSTWNVPCGIATYCANLVTALDDIGVENSVYPIQPHRWHHCLKDDISALVADIRQKALQADLVHIQHEHALFGVCRGSAFAAKQFGAILDAFHRAGRPTVTTFHTDVAPPSRRAPWYAQRLKKMGRHRHWKRYVAHHYRPRRGLAVAIVHSQASRFAFAEAGVDSRAIRVIPHACLSPRSPRHDRSVAKSLLGLPEDTCLLTIFGFLGRYKGYLTALHSLQELPDHYRLAIVGGTHPEATDTFAEELIAEISRLGLRSRVCITGFADQQTSDLFYAATDICLAPYSLIGNPAASGAITWALSSGRPVIASKVPAFQVIQRESDCLLLATPDQYRELAWLIERLADDASLQAKLAGNAEAYCRKHSWKNTATEVAGLYERLLTKMPALCHPALVRRAA